MTDINFIELIENSRPRRQSAGLIVAIFIGLGLLIWALLGKQGSNSGGVVGNVLSFGILFVLLGTMILVEARRQAVTRWSRQASDLCLLEKWNEAFDPLQRLLRRPVSLAQLRYQGLLELAGVAEHTEQLDDANRIYQAIVEEQPSGLLGNLALVGRAIVLLKLDQLADADSIIRQVEVQAEGSGLKSLVILARLYQQIKTGHYAEALADESGKCELARMGMSSKAGYVYALLGLAHARCAGRHQPQQVDAALAAAHTAQAQLLWQEATMLLPADSITTKFPEMVEMKFSYVCATVLPGPAEK